MHILKHIITIILLSFASVANAQSENFPYTYNLYDAAFIGAGGALKLCAMHVEYNQAKMSISELNSLEKSTINALDRSATLNWNKNLSDKSDLTRNILLVAPIPVVANLLINKELKNTLTYGIMFTDVFILSYGITEFTKAVVKRKRPYLYNHSIPKDELIKELSENNVFDSFYSGHSTIAFASAVFISKTYTDIYGPSTWSKVIWASSISIAATTGYLRYASGNHYPSDILAGAFIGSGIGCLIPLIHKSSNDKISFIFAPSSMYFSYNF